MRDPLLPQIMLAAALGLALSYTERGTARQAAGICVVAAIATALLPLPGFPTDLAFAAGWLSVLATAASLHLPEPWRLRAGPWLGRGQALNAGLWVGLLNHMTLSPFGLAFALPFVALMLPGAWLIGRGWGIAIKVAASWLIAIAVLQIALGFVPTPGYEADHME
ncbi:hypothetical protein ABAC460_09125 [Asticcacaulis sp. AC460]|uniref:hypothetical protein n=1 Tax=Asticcacaulis sp. AC460 TaxID=1282360 RepID=UPI0003C40D07|nr:hypothetical protein [Asticcacaulis sp. AC460]ESQ90306.1 hypothetical protein ABAC460_09125 [Asticcacaulis sp. AC460]